jgi:hypothetical protein
MKTKRIALGVIFASIVALALGYASAFLPGGPPRAVTWLFAFAICFICLAAGFAVALLAPAVTPDSRLWLGLPHGAAVILYVVGFLPMLVLPIAYALTFERITMSSAELDDIRARLAALRTAASAPPVLEQEEVPR